MTTERGFSPVGLRVLVVDDDPTWLKILEKMLKKCSYEVTTCGLAREALKLLRERKDGYDIVISDVNMPDMDGFKLLEHVGLEMDLPVIMMSVDGETSRVMKGVQHGACDYLLKPIRMKELKIIWQHVLRKKLQEFRDIEGFEGSDSLWMMRHGFDQSDEVHLLGGEEVSFGKKRKDFEKKPYDDRDSGDTSSTKKARVVWTFELHQKFVNAVNQIGCDHKAGPKKILDLMNVPWLTRENVASHLQKYRLYLSRLEKESAQKSSSGGAKHMDSPPKEADINSGHQSPRKILPAEVPSSSSCAFSGGNSIVQNANQDAANVDPKGIASTPTPESRINDILSPHKVKKARVGFDHSLSPLPSEGNPDAAIDSTVSPQYSWNDVPEVLESKPVLFESSFLQQPLPSQSYYSAHSATSFTETEVKRSYENDQTSGVSRVTPVSEDEFLLAQGKSPTANLQDFDLSIPSAVSCMKPQEFNPSIPSNTESILRNLNWQLPDSHFNTSLDSEFQLCWLQGDYFLANNGLQDIGFNNYSSQSFLAESPFYFYDATRFANDLLPDPDEFTLVDQGLFIA